MRDGWPYSIIDMQFSGEIFAASERGWTSLAASDIVHDDAAIQQYQGGLSWSGAFLGDGEQNMTDDDLQAIYEYLSAIPCIEGPPPPRVLHNDCQ